MNILEVFSQIEKLFDNNSEIEISKIKGSKFTAILQQGYIEIPELSDTKLPMAVFQDAYYLLQENVKEGVKYGKAIAQGIRLGDKGLEITTLEGHIAFHVYGTTIGTAVLQRSYYVGAILVAAGVCEWISGGIRLV